MQGTRKENNMRRSRTFFFAMALVATAGLMWSCYPGGPTSAGETDVVLTYFDDGASFGTFQTYAMPDEVFIREGSDDGTVVANEDLILNQVVQNMARAGYTRVLNPEQNKTDVVVIVSAIQSTNFNYWVSWGWWGGWGGWGGWPGYGPGWGIGYPWVGVTSYTNGSVFVEMFDPNNPDTTEQLLPAVWAGALNGLLSGSSASETEARIVRGIDQAFSQSPYLSGGSAETLPQ